jgi:hypothetical protein
MALKSGFRFQIIASLGVQASDVFDLLMVGYQLELFFSRVPIGTSPDLGVIIS